METGGAGAARSPLLSVLLPGALLFVLGGALVDRSATLGGIVAGCGLVLLVAWPLFTVVIDIRCSRRRKRGLAVPPLLAKVESAVSAIRAVTMLIVLPVAVLGGLGVYCLVTAGDDHDTGALKIVIGIGSLVLLVATLLFVARGRTSTMLRVAGVGLAVFGIGGLSAVWLVLADGFTSVGDVVMLVASIIMTIAGTWLACTGRNTLRST